MFDVNKNKRALNCDAKEIAIIVTKSVFQNNKVHATKPPVLLFVEHLVDSIEEIVETRAWLEAQSMAIGLTVNELVLIIAQQH